MATTGIDERERSDGKISFQAHVWDARNGKRIRKTFDTKTAAKNWRTDAMAALRRGDQLVTTQRGRTVREALEALIAGMRDGTVLERSGRRYRASTIRGYEGDVNRYLIPALGHLRVPEVRRGDVQRLVDKLGAQGLTGSTVRNKLDALHVLYRRARQDEEVTYDPTKELRYPARNAKPRRIAHPGRVGELLDALPAGERAAWSCAFYGGLRVGELRALRWSHVDFEGGGIHVQAGWDDTEGDQGTKTTAGVRTVPLAGKVRADLRAHKLATGRGGDDLVFGRTRTDAFVRSTLRNRARKAWDTAGLDPLTPHEGRHCCASYLAAAGLSPKEAQTVLGHADIRTTMNIYTKAVPGWESRAAGLLDAYLDAPTVAGAVTQLS